MTRVDLSPDLAELLGAYVGDGTMSDNSKGEVVMSIAAGRDAKGWLDHLADIFDKIFHYHPIPRWNKNVFKIQIGKNRICKFFKNMGFPVGEKTLTVRTPRIIMNSNNQNIQESFLRGYFDADGTLCFSKSPRPQYCKFKRTHHYYPRIFLASASESLIWKDIRTLLKSNFRHGIYKAPPRGKGQHTIHKIAIRGEDQVNQWMAKIGSSNPVHYTKYMVWKRFGFCPPRTSLKQRKAILSGRLNPEELYKKNK